MTAPLPTLRAGAERRGRARREYVRPIVIRGWPTLMDLRVAARRARDAGDLDKAELFQRFLDSRLKRAARKLEETSGLVPPPGSASPRASEDAS